MALSPGTISAGISIGKSLFGGSSKKKAAKKAAKAQEAAALRQEAAAKAFDERTQKQTEPYRKFGEGATNKLSDYLGIDSDNPDYMRAENDFKTAQGEYDRLLKTPQLPVKGDFDNRYAQNFGMLGGVAMGEKRKNATANTNNEALIASAKGRLDASRAKLDGTQRTNARSDTFGSLLNSFTENDLNNDVVYNKGLEFGLNEGVKGLNRQNLATGGFDSGAALKELTRYANDYGETKADGAQKRFMGDKTFTFNSLLGGTQTGQNAIGQSIGSSGTALNGKIGAIGDFGNARSAGAIRQGNNSANMIGGIADELGGFNFGDLFKKKNDGFGTVSGFRFGGVPVNKTAI